LNGVGRCRTPAIPGGETGEEAGVTKGDEDARG